MILKAFHRLTTGVNRHCYQTRSRNTLQDHGSTVDELAYKMHKQCDTRYIEKCACWHKPSLLARNSLYAKRASQWIRIPATVVSNLYSFGKIGVVKPRHPDTPTPPLYKNIIRKMINLIYYSLIW